METGNEFFAKVRHRPNLSKWQIKLGRAAIWFQLAILLLFAGFV
jgi:hypothetical protein